MREHRLPIPWEEQRRAAPLQRAGQCSHREGGETGDEQRELPVFKSPCLTVSSSPCLACPAGIAEARRPPRHPQPGSLPEGEGGGTSFAGLLLVLLVAGLLMSAAGLAAGAPAEGVVRELYVPFEDLHVVMEGGPRRVLLSREEYEDLLARAVTLPHRPAPLGALLLAADYRGRIEEDRAVVVATLHLEVLRPGLHAMPLELDHVGLERARLGESAAALGRSEDGTLVLFVEGIGRHRLTLEMTVPVETTAARQTLAFRLPRVPAGRFRLRAPGDVEVRSGATVVDRAVVDGGAETRFELIVPEGDTTLVLTLNSRLHGRQRAVISRGVVVAEVTAAYQRLHARFACDVLHQAVDHFRFTLPEGFEVTEVEAAEMSQWSVEEGPEGSVLSVRLREATTEPVVLNLAALGPAPEPGGWRLPQLRPLDVLGEVAVLGLLAEERLSLEGLEGAGLIPIDAGVLRRVLPETVFRTEPGAPPLVPLAAYFAPQADYGLEARFARRPAELAVTTNLLAVLDDSGMQLRGGFSLLPREEKCFAVELAVPDGWHVESVAGEGRQPLPVERYPSPDGGERLRVGLLAGIEPGQQYPLFVEARHTPAGWLDPWDVKELAFPALAVRGADQDRGALAVAARDDLAVRPTRVEGLVPLDENEKGEFGLEEVRTDLAFGYEAPPYRAEFIVARTPPRLTARSVAFFAVESEVLAAHYEITYNIEDARARELSLALPATTPASLAIRGLDGLRLKEYTATEEGGLRRWDVLLEEPRRGAVRLAVDFQQARTAESAADALPLLTALDVAYQSGLVAVEGSAEVEVQVETAARSIDVGELVEADYEPGPRLLGAYQFVGDPVEVRARVVRHPQYGLYPAVVERAHLTTLLAAEGRGQSAARFELRTKAPFLEIELPSGSQLWSADLDGRPIKPQRDGDSLLVSLPATDAAERRALRVVYETPVATVRLLGAVSLPAPQLRLRGAGDVAAVEVPLVDLKWDLLLPEQYEVVRSDGTVSLAERHRSEPALVRLARGLYRASGGIPGPLLLESKMSADRAAMRAPAVVARPSRDVPGVAVEAPAADFDAYAPGEAVAPPLAAPSTPAAEPRAPESEPEPAPPPPERPAIQQAEAPPPPARPSVVRDLSGLSSLLIALDETQWPAAKALSFTSLGVEPRLEITLAQQTRLGLLAWGVALAVVLAGLAMTFQPAGAKVRFLLAVVALATLLAVVPRLEAFTGVCDAAVYAAAALGGYFVLVGCVRLAIAEIGRLVARARHPGAVAARTAAAGLAATLAAFTGSSVQGQTDAPPAPYVIETVEPVPPVAVPEDAIVIPYDPDAEDGLAAADQRLIPYDRYVELWNRAYPDDPIDTAEPPVPFALAGAEYRTRLEGGDHLWIGGRLDVELYEEGRVVVPLAVRGAVVSEARLDGRPARLAPAEGSDDNGAMVLVVEGRGRHQLDLVVRLPLSREGGWHVAEGALPSAPASALSVVVPEAGTEVRLSGPPDRGSLETAVAEERLSTALGAGGALRLRWRPRISEGLVDRSLTAHSTAVLDVQEDGLRLAWQLLLQFPRSQREHFTMGVPADYLLEAVEGRNVRGWEVRDENGRRRVEVSLLKPARDDEQLVLRLWREGPIGQDEATPVETPCVTVAGAALHHGELIVRRSPLLDLRSVEMTGASRTDLDDIPPFAGHDEESPLGIRPFQAFRFAAVPFTLRLAAEGVAGRRTAQVQTLLRISERHRAFESRVLLSVEDRPVYQIALLLPAGLELDHVAAPGAYRWTLVDDGAAGAGGAPVQEEAEENVSADGAADRRQRLLIFLPEGQQGPIALVIAGRLGAPDLAAGTALPQLTVLEVDRQQGHIAVQVDPALNVEAADLEDCESVPAGQVSAWVTPQQQALTRLAIRHRTGDYGGTLRFSRREPDVRCTAISNVRVTDRAIEETILLEYTILSAGVREVVFLLPPWMGEARIHAPMLRRREMEAVGEGDEAMLRVRLHLQDAVMDQLRVLVEHDRLLASGLQAAPLPVVETGRVERRLVTLQGAGRDELVVVDHPGLEPLSRQQRDWQWLQAVLGEGITQAFVAAPGAARPQLLYRTEGRETVRTAGARIGLAATALVVDAHGAYRGELTLKVDNATDQFLDVELPENAHLFTAFVADSPVKPTLVPDAPQQVRIPLVKTAEGELDFPVVLKYGGRMAAPSVARAASFPLMRVTGVQVELSQVRLHLPEEYTWFDFGGTMRLVGDEAELAGGYLAYKGRVAERLVETARHGNPFARVRAWTNLKLLREHDLTLDGSVSLDYDLSRAEEKLQRSLSEQEALFERAEVELRQLAEAPQEELAFDNRFYLNTRFEQQNTVRAESLVHRQGRNFAEAIAPPPTDRPEEAARFNEAWFGRARLEGRGEVDEVLRERLRKAAADPEQRARTQQAPAATRAGEVAGERWGDDASAYGVPALPQSQADAVTRYQQRLGSQLEGRGGRRAGDEFAEAADRSLPVRAPMEPPSEQEAFARTLGLSVDAEGVLPVGLASLDFELPRRGQVFLFTTPGGRVEITARGLSGGQTEGLAHLAALVVAVLVLGGLVGFGRGGGFGYFAGRNGAALLVVAGLLGILFGVLPVAAAVLLVVGSAIALLRFVERRLASRAVASAPSARA